MRRLPLGLLLALAVGLAVRLVGLDALLPHAEEPDTYVVDQAALFTGEPERVPIPWKAETKAPHLVGRAVAAATWLLPEPAVAVGAPLEEHLARAAFPTWRARLVVALLSCLAIPAVWWLGRRLWWERGGRAGTLAALLMASSLLHVTLSTQARPHAVLAATTAMALAGAVWLRGGRRAAGDRGGGGTHGVGAWLLVGALGALALGSLHFGVFVLPALLAAHVLRVESPRRPVTSRLAAGLVPLLLAVPAFYPFVLWPPSDPAAQMTGARSWLGAHDPALVAWDPAGLLRVPEMLASADPVLVGVVALALGLACVPAGRRRLGATTGDVLVLLAFAVPLLLVMGGMPRLQQRYLTSLLPVLAVFGGLGLAALLPGSGSGPKRAPVSVPDRKRGTLTSGVAWTLVVLVLAVPVATAARMAWLRTQPDTYELAADHLRTERSREDDRLLIESGMDLPLVPMRSAVAASTEVQPTADSRWQRTVRRTLPALPTGERWWFALIDPPGSRRRVVRAGPESRAWVRDQLLARRADLVLLGASPFQRRQSLHEAVAHFGTRVARLGVAEDESGLRLANGYQDRDLFLRVWRTERLGTPLELFEIPSPRETGPDR